MIYLFTGTPGSGKSLDVARMIKTQLYLKRPVICNFPISDKVKNYKYFTYKRNEELNVDYLMQFARDFFGGHRVKEGAITLVIDECQMLFNSRDWSKPDRQGWNKFFQIHRHFGFDVILVTQFDSMIDKQIRALVEYEVVHRKISNYGWRGYLLQLFMLAPTLFVKVKVWYPMKEKVDSEFFRGRKSLYALYDTYALSFVEEDSSPALGLERSECPKQEENLVEENDRNNDFEEEED